jgi:hypothetical protein
MINELTVEEGSTCNDNAIIYDRRLPRRATFAAAKCISLSVWHFGD